MFRFTSLFYRAADFEMAIKIMINNGRYVFNAGGNQTTSYLFDWNGEPLDAEGREFAVPFCQNDRGWCGTLSRYNELHGYLVGDGVDINNSYTQAWYYDGPSVAGQREEPGEDGVPGWRSTRLLPPSNPRSTNNQDFTNRTGRDTPAIPQNVWDGLNLLFTSGGTTYDSSKLRLTATDDSFDDAGSNYNVWPVANISAEKNTFTVDKNNYQTAQGNLDQWGCAYEFPNGTSEQILYNFDNITGSPILPGVEKSRKDFEKLKDANRTIPNTRYLKIQQGDIDIKFSYVTELIKIQEGDSFGGSYHMAGADYLGARITLWTGSYQ